MSHTPTPFRFLVSTSAFMFVVSTVSFAEPRERPAIPISQAASAAEAELGRRGLAGDHFISSIIHMPATKDAPRHYRAIIAPPVVLSASSDSGSGKQKFLEFRIDMSGAVSAAEYQLPEAHRSIRLEVQPPKP